MFGTCIHQNRGHWFEEREEWNWYRSCKGRDRVTLRKESQRDYLLWFHILGGLNCTLNHWALWGALECFAKYKPFLLQLPRVGSVPCKQTWPMVRSTELWLVSIFYEHSNTAVGEGEMRNGILVKLKRSQKIQINMLTFAIYSTAFYPPSKAFRQSNKVSAT